MAMIERVRGPSELRSIAQRAHRLLWAQSVEDYQRGADAMAKRRGQSCARCRRTNSTR